MNPTTSIIYNTFFVALKRMKEINPDIDKVLDIIAYLSPDYVKAQLIEDFHRKKELEEQTLKI